MRARPVKDSATQPDPSRPGSERSELSLSDARNMLEQRRARFVALRAAHEQQREELLRDQGPMDNGDASVREDFVDRQDRFEERDTRELQAIDAALARIESGTYGSCQRCGDPIGGDRLRAIPETPLCIVCAEPQPTSPEFNRLENQSLKL
jgi:RNA polymerase-binding protein DksA